MKAYYALFSAPTFGLSRDRSMTYRLCHIYYTSALMLYMSVYIYIRKEDRAGSLDSWFFRISQKAKTQPSSRKKRDLSSAGTLRVLREHSADVKIRYTYRYTPTQLSFNRHTCLHSYICSLYIVQYIIYIAYIGGATCN